MSLVAASVTKSSVFGHSGLNASDHLREAEQEGLYVSQKCSVEHPFDLMK
jgi:hypothetical protein